MAKTIYIAGLGLIGASMALGIKRDHPDYEILGYNRSQASRDIALKEGMIDRATDDFASFAPLADIIILSLPIKQTIAFIKELADLALKEGVIISDAGSTKSAIVDAAEQYLAGKPVRFVGAHPRDYWAAMEEDRKSYFFIDVQARGEYPNYAKKQW